MDESVDSSAQNTSDYNLEQIQTIQDINFVNQNLGTGFYSEISDKKDTESNGINSVDSTAETIQDVCITDIPVTEDSSVKLINTEVDAAIFTLSETTPTTSENVQANSIINSKINVESASAFEQENYPEPSDKSVGDNQVSNSTVEETDYIVTNSGSADDANQASEEPSTSTLEALPESTEHLEITEVTETIEDSEDVPYTVLEIEPEEVTSATESVATNTENERTETVVFVEESADLDSEFIPEQQDNELFIVTPENEELDFDPLLVQSVNKTIKKPRGRKSGNSIPSHVLGVNINSPHSDPISNGNRKVPKPRLGVKVPCRNLASQIVTKREIEDELMKHIREKQKHNDKIRSDTLFARKLTQRLANKIAPSPTQKKSLSPVLTNPSSPVVVTKVSPEASASTSSAIENNSDLLAILEGEDDEAKAEEQKKIEQQKIKDMEKEIALKQLQDLPNIEPVISASSRYYRMKGNPATNKDSKEIVKSNSTVKQKPGNSSVKNSNNSSPPKLKPEVTQPTSKSESSVKKFVEVESQLKASMVIKTYSRKRKSIEATSPVTLPKKPLFVEEPNAEINLPTPKSSSDAYVTKSSRVIKKKVIWDPDDEIRTPTKAIVKSIKHAESQGTPKTAAPVLKVADKKLAAEKVAAAVAKVFDKKLMSEKISEKKLDDKEVEVKKTEKVKTASEKKTDVVEKKIPIKKVVSPSPKKHKRLTEIDKLLQDEGAVNMLYEVKNTDKNGDGEVQRKKKKAVISLDKAHKELRSKASELLKDLKQNTGEETPSKYLRKKDSPPTLVKEVIPGTISRKKSKDSVRSSVHSPPASPAFPYEASRIIRRHSSSSFSSTDGGSLEEGSSERVSKKKQALSSDVPKAKKLKKGPEPLTPQQKTSIKKDMVKNFNTTTKPPESENDVTPIEEPKSPSRAFTVKRTDQLVTINLNYTNNNYFLTAQILKDLTAMLNKLGKDSHCNTVSLLSTGKYYCQGLDYSTLVGDSEEVCKKKANELALCVKEFLRCLLKFPKVLVAGIQGDCVGLGVTMLPLFDVVIASDKANFSMPYGKLGSVSEAGFLLTVPHITNHALASELLFASSKISASEASRYGLVTRLCWPEKYNDELKTMVGKISKQSRKSIEATKKQVRLNLIESTEAAINSQTKVLVEHWTSEECQKKFAEYKLD